MKKKQLLTLIACGATFFIFTIACRNFSMAHSNIFGRYQHDSYKKDLVQMHPMPHSFAFFVFTATAAMVGVAASATITSTLLVLHSKVMPEEAMIKQLQLVNEITLNDLDSFH